MSSSSSSRRAVTAVDKPMNGKSGTASTSTHTMGDTTTEGMVIKMNDNGDTPSVDSSIHSDALYDSAHTDAGAGGEGQHLIAHYMVTYLKAGHKFPSDGRLYLKTDYIKFKPLIGKSKKIPWKDDLWIEKAKTNHSTTHNGIRVVHTDGQSGLSKSYLFVFYPSVRDSAYEKMERLLEQNGGGAGGGGVGVAAAAAAAAAESSSYVSSSTTSSKKRQSAAGESIEGGKKVEFKIDEDDKTTENEDDASTLVALPPAAIEPDPILPKMTTFIDNTILKDITVQEFYDIVWSEGNGGTNRKPLYGPWLTSCGKKDVNVGEWEKWHDGRSFINEWCQEEYTQRRVVTFNFQGTFGNPEVTHTHHCRIENEGGHGGDRCVLAMTVKMKGIPFSDSFEVEVRWVAERVNVNDISLSAGLVVDFKKSCLVAGKIRKNTTSETSRAQTDLCEVMKRACTKAKKKVNKAKEGVLRMSAAYDGGGSVVFEEDDDDDESEEEEEGNDDEPEKEKEEQEVALVAAAEATSPRAILTATESEECNEDAHSETTIVAIITLIYAAIIGFIKLIFGLNNKKLQPQPRPQQEEWKKNKMSSSQPRPLSQQEEEWKKEKSSSQPRSHPRQKEEEEEWIPQNEVENDIKDVNDKLKSIIRQLLSKEEGQSQERRSMMGTNMTIQAEMKKVKDGLDQVLIQMRK